MKHTSDNAGAAPFLPEAEHLAPLPPVSIARTSKSFRVVIIGGSFAGIRAAQDLEQQLPPHSVTITVIDKRDRYFYNLGALRAVVRPDLIDLVWLPYDKVFRHSHNRVIQGEVASVYPNSVILRDGRKMDFDSLLVATGSVYPPPCKVDMTSHIQGKAEMYMFAEKVRTANAVLIIGGGPTGVGLAAEIATVYPQKTVILIHAGPRLLSSESNSKSMSRKAHKKLKAMGVKIILNERVNIPDNEPLTYRIECRWLKTSKGRMIFSDLQFLCNGITFNTSLMDTLDPVFKNNIIDTETGQIRVLPTMQINHPELPWIFSAGDVCNTPGEKQAYRADSQGTHVAKCMAKMAQAWASGDSMWYDVSLKQWNDPAQFMAVAMGPNAGITDTPWIVLGDLPTRIMKSKELFLARRYKEF
ncbi:FAD/NAD(P)-binding domain-containing protein, partial [Martensiomyces pterosporus]